MKFLIGCYTNTKNEQSLHLLEFDKEYNAINLINSHIVSNPSYLLYANSKSIIYTVNEDHTSSDSLTALSFNKENLTLETINDVEIKGSDPCFINVDSNLRHIFSANYSDGTLSCITLKQDGSFDKLAQVIKHEINPLDKLHPNTHIHATVLSPCERFLLVSNLGQDTITVYNYQPSEVQPLSETGMSYQFPVGTGPRHLIFDQNAKFVYVVGELDASLHVLAWDNGGLTFIQQLMLMPVDFKGKNSAADIHFGANGNFLYVSNRGGANQLISFSINQKTGRATFLERTSSLGKGPRNFAIDPSGKFLLVTHQYTDDIRLFNIDPLNGKLYDTGNSFKLNSPVFVCFLS